MVFDVAIVGGGLVGTSLALGLGRAGFHCALVEAGAPVGPRPDAWDSRIYAVSPASQSFLESIGVWQEIDVARLAPVYDMQVHGDRGGQLRFSAHAAGADRLATIVEAATLQQALRRSLPAHRRLRVFCPDRPLALSVQASHAELVLEHGGSLPARLVVGADGARSWMREAAGFTSPVLQQRDAAVVANFQCEHAHADTAYQWFGEAGVLAWLPLPGRRISMVWSTDAERAALLASLDNGALADAAAQAGDRRLGAFEVITPAAVFPLSPYSLDRRVGSRVALIGDAAHVIHPLAGQGLNLGFADARELVKVVAGTGGDPGAWAALRRFERARAEDILAMRLATDGLQRLFATRSPLLAAARNAGLNLTGRLAFLNNGLARRAMRNG